MEAVLDTFASKLADILLGMAKEEVEMLLGVPGEITKLETTLGDLSSILGDAERRRIGDLAAERWVRELKDVMYDAENILDLCQIMEDEEDPSVSKPSSSGCWNIPNMFFCFRNPVAVHEIGKKIQALSQRLLELERRSSRFGFISQAINSLAPSTNKAADSWSYGNQGPTQVDSDIVGEKVEESKRKLVDLLTKKVDAPVGSIDGSNVTVAVAITGSGGIGKTTLARAVFNDATVANSFDKKIWLSVGKVVNEIRALERLIAASGGSYDKCAGDRALLERTLKQAVRQRKSFLVLDDLWTENCGTSFLEHRLVMVLAAVES